MDIFTLPWFILIPYFVGLTVIVCALGFTFFMLIFMISQGISDYLIKKKKNKN